MIKKLLIKIYELFYEKRRVLLLRIKYRLRIMSPYKTLHYIKKHHCSIARYGDGEFDHILDLKDEGFQTRSQKLTDELSRVLTNKNKNLLLCIPRCYISTKGCNDHSKTFWIEWGKNGHHELIINLIREKSGNNYRFGDSQITRPYIDWKTKKRAKKNVSYVKSVMER